MSDCRALIVINVITGFSRLARYRLLFGQLNLMGMRLDNRHWHEHASELRRYVRTTKTTILLLRFTPIYTEDELSPPPSLQLFRTTWQKEICAKA